MVKLGKVEGPIQSNAAAHEPPKERARSRWAMRMGSLFGIDIYVHGTFLLLLAWVGGSQLMRGAGAAAAFGGIVLVLAVFAIVVLHELGHALMARRFGIGTRDIMLLPIGGVASLERMPDDPKQELLVALAGPAVNFVLAALCFVGVHALGQTAGAGSVLVVGAPLLGKLMWINLSLGIFNLLPAFPMDGGRVLRAALALRMEHMRATDLAARIGQGLAVLLGIAGLFSNPMLMLIAVFVWSGARNEASLEHVRTSVQGTTVAEVMQGGRSLMADEPLREATRVLSSPQEAFPVIEGGEVVGVLAREELLRAAGQGSLQRVSDVMTRDVVIAEPSLSLMKALEALGGASAKTLFVVDGGRLVGMVTPNVIRDLIIQREAARTPLRRSSPTS